MSPSRSNILSIVLPVATVLLTIAIATAILIHRYLRQRTLLPTTEPPLFTAAHIASIRAPRSSVPTTPTENPWPTLKSDLNHIPFLAAPLPSHQPIKGNWQKFKEKQALRKEQARMPQVMREKWHHQPKGSAYWREHGKSMRAEMGWWEKAKEKVGW
ncbi:hypothetical protein HBI70_142150 [Parastagonospora nodorum]|nr:hypothetical protein HBH52_159150 [Parastagonospora nodorum]KAH4097525.1 hypothetical protein HBH46_159070 [Parastagonospora nodorum]KAH4905895.1 hypothetical protein HBI80_093300 [Parastagonospora nodorum]KAH4963681.1 hypothetical protein HBI78_117680 [Parastagonospora nodorum]KAH5055613.1 hypothetical protein HBH96_126430 [Parastagonospora nodorum]